MITLKLPSPTITTLLTSSSNNKRQTTYIRYRAHQAHNTRGIFAIAKRRFSLSLSLLNGSSSRRRAVVRRVNNILTIVGSSVLGALLLEHSVVVVVADLEAEASWVDVAVAPEEEGTEDGLGEEVEDAVEDGFAIGGDDVAIWDSVSKE